MAIDGSRLIALSTATPLWRSLGSGDRGDDVLALQAELTRLGYPTGHDGTMGPATIRALGELRAALQLPALSSSSADAMDFVWLPQPELEVSGCVGVVGTMVTSGDELMALPVRAVSARLSTIPQAAVPGSRSIRVGALSLPVDEEGAVVGSEALDQVSALPEFASASGDDGSASIPVTWVLSSPVTALVIPPTALWDVKDGTACVQPMHGGARQVKVLGSDLGQTFVSAADTMTMHEVRASPSTRQSCR